MQPGSFTVSATSFCWAARSAPCLPGAAVVMARIPKGDADGMTSLLTFTVADILGCRSAIQPIDLPTILQDDYRLGACRNPSLVLELAGHVDVAVLLHVVVLEVVLEGMCAT